MDKYQICNIHQERVEFASRDFKSNELIGLCVRCLPLPQGMPYQQINNIFINIEENKTLMLNVLEEQKIQNKEIIRKLADYVKEFKKSQEMNFEKLINQSELEINKIEKKYNSAQKQIAEYNSSIDVEELMNLYTTLLNDNILAETQCNLVEILKKIEQHSFLFDTYKILQEFPSITNYNRFNENKNYLKKIYKCTKHNELVVGVDLSQKQSQVDDLVCLTCIKNSEQKIPFTQLEETEKGWESYCNNSRWCYQNLQKMVQTVISQSTVKVFQKYNKIQDKLEAYLNVLSKYKIQKLNQYNTFMPQLKLNCLDYNSTMHIEYLKKITKLSNSNWKYFILQLNKLPYVLEQLPLSNTLRCLKSFTQQVFNVQIDQVEQIKTKISFELITTVKQEEICYAMAINSAGKILVAGCENYINVFEFNSPNLNQLQQLDGHDSDVTCLEFMKHKNIFASGSRDSTIKIWIESQLHNWNVTQTLQGHNNLIHCLTITSTGDQIISGSEDKSIIFWNLENQKDSQSISSKFQFYALSLNESETKLISCGVGLILVFEQVGKNFWSLIQNIVFVGGYRVCFITNNLFAFQPICQGKIYIYEQTNSQNEFQQSASIKIQENTDSIDMYYFPQKFIKSKQLLVSKQSNYLNIIKRDENGNFLFYSHIQFESSDYYGAISDNGEFLIIWDEKKGEIQLRQYQEMILN